MTRKWLVNHSPENSSWIAFGQSWDKRKLCRWPFNDENEKYNGWRESLSNGNEICTNGSIYILQQYSTTTTTTMTKIVRSLIIEQNVTQNKGFGNVVAFPGCDSIFD